LDFKGQFLTKGNIEDVEMDRETALWANGEADLCK
jgi:hypothetical protein